ncbi:MAG: DNA primase [Bacteroidota bacterium]
MIPEKTVQEILDTARIEDVVEEFVSLKRRGSNMIGLCPFHNEKTPSFTVSPSKNLFKCFGCGKGGSSVQFLMEHEGHTFPEALRYLAKKYNIEIEEIASSKEHIEERKLQDSLYIVNQYAQDFYQKQLFESDAGKSIGLSYFKDRGFREETIRKFGLGFAPNGKNIFTQQALSIGHKEEMLKQLGLTSQYGSDFFRNRVMFTIHNLAGKVIAFAGRILTNDKKAPKYINSPETDIYNKSRVLYGAYFAKKAIRQLDECILVEGYTDVISLHQAGIENVVASSGTSLTVGQIQLIKRYTPNIKILYDGDPAGIKAALRGLDLVLEQDMNVKVVLLPEGEDPDSYLQSVGASEFRKYVDEQAKDFILFKTQLLMAETANDPIKRSELIKDIVSSIALIPDPIKRSLYIRECSTVMEVSEELLVEESNRAVALHMRKQRQEERREQRRREREQQRKPQSPSRPQEGPPARSGDGYFPDAPPALSEEEAELIDGEPATTAPPKRAIGNEFQEKDIIRLLIESGSKWHDEAKGINIATFILSEIEEIIDDFDNPLYGRIAKDCLQRLVTNKSVDTQYFLNHSDTEISKIAVDLIHSPFEYSPNWEEKHSIVLRTQPMPELNFTKDSEQALNRFKFSKIGKMLKVNQERIKKAQEENDWELMQRYIKVDLKLRASRSELASILKTVIPPPTA